MDNQKRIDKGNVKLSTHNSKLKTASMSDSADTSCPLQGKSIKPAGRAQVNGRDNLPIPVKVEFDVHYLEASLPDV